ncbi:MAG: hypothetical protein HYV97_16545 [Bdellovibrio sp.]|nr:hypothetical protein [Bdellovibrio sp.]
MRRIILLLLASSVSIFVGHSAAMAEQLSDRHVDWRNNSSWATLVGNSSDINEYLLRTTHLLRDDLPRSKERLVRENRNYPIMRSNSPLFDAIYAMSINEVEENCVEEVRDSSFSTGNCHCFETGRKWTYIWTRDISYSAHLALAGLNQTRTKNTLLFKVSKRRNQSDDTAEIIQDTGTGGSWPLSTDRVVWAMAAWELLHHLTGEERSGFLQTSFRAIQNTVENDRLASYDPNDGLYTGEQSFLDWREQSYPRWVADNVVHIGMSKSLSTNVAHYMALHTLSLMALELKRATDHERYQKLASELASKINLHFWDEEKGLYRAYLVTYLDRAPVDKYDLLGNALAVLSDIPQTEAQKNCLENYPLVLAGAPVIWPQAQEIAIYHNRAIWPFVTAYAMLASSKNRQAALFNHLFRSMIRGAALNLSNMENFEFLSMNNWLDDGNLSGPVVNSQRQLWSVAGMLAVQLKMIFGLEVEKSGIRFNPFITAQIRNSIFKNSNELKLNDYRFLGKLITVRLKLPTISSDFDDKSYYIVTESLLNGVVRPDHLKYLSKDDLLATNELVITLGTPQKSNGKIKLKKLDNPFGLSSNDYEALYAPEAPQLFPLNNRGGYPELSFNTESYRNISYNIYRNGALIKKQHHQKNFIDHDWKPGSTACYVVEVVFDSSGNRSLHSEPQCFWESDSISVLPAAHAGLSSFLNLSYFTDHGRNFVRLGEGQQEFIEFRNFSPAKSGTFALQLNYNNLGYVNTGITAAVKKVEVINQEDGEVVRSGVFMMPHHTTDRYWIDSNFVTVALSKYSRYIIRVSDFYNMSYFEHFMHYLYRGGRSGQYNQANVTELKVLFITTEVSTLRNQ